MIFNNQKSKWCTIKIAVGITVMVILLVGGVSAIPVEKWNKTYGGNGNDYAWTAKQTTDYGYIIAGSSDSYGGAWLIKVDVNGIEEWNKTYDYGGIYPIGSFVSVQQTIDGGFVTISENTITKTDVSGNKQCENKFQTYGTILQRSIIQTTDGGYVIVGRITLEGLGRGNDILLIKVHPDCNEEWRQIIWSYMSEEGYSVKQTSDGGFIIVASESQTYINTLLIKTDSNGNEQWRKTFGGNGYSYGFSVEQTTDGGYVIGGQTTSYTPLYVKAWLIKTDSNGIEQWNKTYGGEKDDENYVARQTKDGGYVLAGVTRSSKSGSWHRAGSLIKTEANGKQLWNMTFGGWSDDYVYSVEQTTDEGYILVGTTWSYGAENWKGRSDAWLIKVSADDTNPPNTTISLSGILGNNNWYTSNVQVTLIATDDEGGLGVAKTEYSINGGISWTLYSVPFTISNEGTTTIQYKSTDIAGNVETIKSQDINIDKTPPASITNLTNISYASSYINWTWTDPTDEDFVKVKVYLDGDYKQDVLKGVQYYNVTVSPGTYTIGTITVDSHGNSNATMKTHTSTTILPTVRYINGTVIDSITKDGLSGVTVSTGSISSTTDGSGNYSLAVYSGSYPLTATFDIRYYTNKSVSVSTEFSAVVVQDIELIKKPIGSISGIVTKV